MTERATQADEADSAENTWQKLLASCTKASSENNTTLIVLGDKGNGKRSLFSKFKDVTPKKDRTPYLVHYSYVAVRNMHETDASDVRPHMSIWAIDNEEHAPGLLPGLLRSNGMERTAYMITFDLSKPWTVMKSIEKWMDVLKKTNDDVLLSLPQKKQAALRERISKYNQFFVDASHKTDDFVDPSIDDVKVDTDQPKKNLGVPLVLVGLKGDLLPGVIREQSGSGDRFVYMVKALRKFALDYGATLFLTSAKGVVNVDPLQEYIFHRLYDYEMKTPAKLERSTEEEYDVYVPSGYDNQDLIDSIKPAKVCWNDGDGFDVVFKAPAKKPKVTTQRQVQPEVKADNNDIFFKTLKMDVKKNKGKSKPTAERKTPADLARGLSSPSSVDLANRSRSVMQKVTTKRRGASKDHQDHVAVKDFFRQLLSNSGDRGAANSRSAKAKQAMESIKAKSPSSHS